MGSHLTEGSPEGCDGAKTIVTTLTWAFDGHLMGAVELLECGAPNVALKTPRKARERNGSDE